MRADAYLSKDRVYRYWLVRVWDDSLPMLCVIGVNPSTADERDNDPTIRKTIGFASRLGFGGVLMLNVGAYRATDPRNWKKADDPFGDENTVTDLLAYIDKFGATKVVAAWGKNCSTHPGLNRAMAIEAGIPGLECWGRNGDGTPRHPLMLAYSTELVPFGASAKN